MSDYYHILGVASDASQEEIKRAYRKLALRFHPDKNREDSQLEATRKFREISKAYEVLSNPRSRQQYDMQFNGHHESFVNDFVHRDPFEMFRDFFDIHRDDIFDPSLFAFDETLHDIASPGMSGVSTRIHRSTITKHNGKVTETRTDIRDNQEIIEVFENGVLRSRTVNGIQQQLPSTSSSSGH